MAAEFVVDARIFCHEIMMEYKVICRGFQVEYILLYDDKKYIYIYIYNIRSKNRNNYYAPGFPGNYYQSTFVLYS